MQRYSYFAAFTLLVLCAEIVAAQSHAAPAVSSQYDKFKDVTLVRVETMPVVNPGLSLALGFSGSYPGRVPITPRFVTAYFSSASNQEHGRYEHNTGVIVLADGERFRLGAATRSIRRIAGDAHLEFMSLDIPFKKLKWIIRAKKVEIQIGNTEFVLSPDYMKALRQFVRSFSPSSRAL